MKTWIVTLSLALLGVFGTAELAKAGPPGFAPGYPYGYPAFSGPRWGCVPPPPRYCPPHHHHHHHARRAFPQYPVFGGPVYHPGFPGYGFPGYQSGFSFGFTAIR